MAEDIGEQSTVFSAPGLITQYVYEGEAIIHPPNSTVYYGLNTVGSRIWSLIQNPTTVKQVNEILLLEYDVQHEESLAELLGLLNNLIALGLVRQVDGEAE